MTMNVFLARQPMQCEPLADQNILNVVFRYVAIFSGFSAFGNFGVPSIFWVLTYGFVLIFLLLHLGAVLQAAFKNWPYILYPLICWGSVLWSVSPSHTISYSLMLTFTYLAALLIGMTATTREILRTTFFVLIFVTVCSLLNLTGIFSNPWDHRNNFKGVLASKNTLGHTMVMLSLFSLYQTFSKATGGLGIRLAWSFLFVLALCVIFLADSAASLATAVVYGAALSIALVVLRTGLGLLFVVGAGSIAISLVLVLIAVIQMPFDELMYTLLSRDATMTGRTIIWDVGWNAIAERPVLGYGANSYWHWGRSANLVDVLQAQYGANMHGFHNLIIEVLVMVGPFGLFAIMFGYLYSVMRAVQSLYSLDPELGVLVLVFLILVLTISMIDIALYKEHSLFTMLPIAFGVSFGRMRQAERAYPKQSWQ